MAHAKTIRIAGDGGGTRIGINGNHRRLPHNEDVAVSAAELSMLENSHVTFEVVGDASAKEAANAVDLRGELDTDQNTGTQPAGGDNLNSPAPVDNLVLLSQQPENDTPAGADNLTQTPGIGEESAEQLADAREAAEEADEKAEDGTTEPVVVLRNTDPDMEGLDASNNNAAKPAAARKRRQAKAETTKPSPRKV